MNDEDLFFEALEIPPDQREHWLGTACADDSQADRLRALLAAHAAPSSMFARPAHELAQTNGLEAWDETSLPAVGSQIGPYQLLAVIGQGGMGVVYAAQQESPLRRKVAIKIIRPGLDSQQVARRFDVERQALAQMDHPHIARIYDGGATEDGQSYFVMELVDGVPLTRFCDEHRLNTRARLKLFLDVCRAVQHAHQRGIIHRDLKQANILVADGDGAAVVKVIDFGVAKAIAQEQAVATLHWQFGELVGTPEYMSPEQARLDKVDVDTRTDVYSLGVVLYELLAGMTPLDSLLPKESSFDDVLRTIRETDSPRPSTVLSQNEKLADVAAARQTRPRDLPRQLRGELDWIVLKCLEKDRERRYQSPEDLARDLENHLSDRPIVARPPSLWRGMWKYARRHRVRAALWALASAAVLFVCFAAIFLWYDGKVRQFQSRQRQLQLDSRMAQYESNAAQLDEHIAKAKEQVRLANEQARRENFGRNVALRQLADIARLYLGEIDREQDTLTEDETTRLHQLLPIYLGLAKTAPNQEVPPTVQAAGLSGAGRVRLLLGETKQAETELRQAAVLWEKLVTDYPTLTEFRYQYAACLFDLGQICRASQREAEAIEHYERAQRLLSKSMVGLMAKPAARSELRQTLVALRAVSEQQGDAARLEAAQTALNKLEAMPELKVQFHLPEQKVRLQLRPPPPSTGEEKARP